MILKFPLKTALIFCITFISFTNSNAQTLFSVGNEKVSKEEFLNAYNKNKTQNESEKSFREYLDLFVNYKLKVKAAESLRLDTLYQIRTDIQNFRKQLQEGFLIDEASTTKLLNEALERGSSNIHVIHFYSPVSNSADSLKAMSAVNIVTSELKKGRKDYEQIALEASGVYPVKFSDPGFISVFSVPYNFETLIYNLKEGEISKPLKTSSGIHLFKSIEKRPDIGKWKISQILFAIEPGASAQEVNAQKSKADSVYNLLKSGLEFSTAAMKFSDDKLSYSLGGELPEFGSGKYAPDFETRILDLKQDGDLSKPFKTSYGFHILKRIHNTPYTDVNDQNVIYETRQKLLRDNRIQSSVDKFNHVISKNVSPKILNTVSKSELFRLADTVISDLNQDRSGDFKESQTKIIQYKKGTVNVADWLKYVRNYYLSVELNKGERSEKLWDKFITFSNREYYKNNLEDYSPQFKSQIKEFSDGNVLFEIMERNVWGKSSDDTIGLRKYYEAHKDSYTWQKSAEILAVASTEIKETETILSKLKAGVSIDSLSAEFPNAHIDSGRYELNQIAGLENSDNIKDGYYTDIIKTPEGGGSFISILKVYPGGQHKSLEDGRGSVINDYQVVLEEEWVKSLRKKYPVKINEEEVKKIIQEIK